MSEAGAAPRVILFGAGRMGRLLYAASADHGFTVSALVARHRPDWGGDRNWASSLDELSEAADLVIDFSLPDGTAAAAAWCAQHRVPLLSGTTGLGQDEEAALDAAAEQVPVLWAANFSRGVQLCLELVTRAAATLGDAGSLHITDVHHVHKQDAPSGTALALGAAAAPLEAAYESIREGEIVGRHEVRFGLPGEEVRIVHEASDRSIYARGALAAGRWLLDQAPGRYTAADWMRGG